MKIEKSKGILLMVVLLVTVILLNNLNIRSAHRKSNTMLSKSEYKQDKKRTKERVDKNYSTDKYIVKYKDETKLNNFKKGIGSKVKSTKENKDKKISVITTKEKMKLEDITSEIKKNNLDADIEYIQPDYTVELSSVPSFNDQWSINNNNFIKAEEKDGKVLEYKLDSNVTDAWEKTKGSGITVAVLDSGIDIGQEDLKKNIFVNTKEIPSNGIDDDGKGVIGVAPQATLLPIKVFDNGVAYTSEIIDAINYAEKMGAKIVNCSWGTSNYSPVLEEAIKNSGMLFVCTAGNDGQDLDMKPVYPACFKCDNIITVGAINKNGTYSLFSNYGELSVDIAAPGEDILSTVPDNKYDKNSGTSMATAFISGEAALIMSKNKKETASSVKNSIINSGDRLSSLVGKVSKAKILNCTNAINEVYPEDSNIKKLKGSSQSNNINSASTKSDGYDLYSIPTPPPKYADTDIPIYEGSTVSGSTTPISYKFIANTSGLYDITISGTGVTLRLMSSNKELIDYTEGNNILVSGLEQNKTYYLFVSRSINNSSNNIVSRPYSLKISKESRTDLDISRGYMDRSAMIYNPNGEYSCCFKTVEAGSYSIFTTGSLNTYGYIYDSNDMLVAASNTDSNSNMQINCNLKPDSIYKIIVRTSNQISEGYSSFKLEVRYEDGDNSFEGAKDISNVSNIARIESRISYPTDEDYYKFSPKVSGNYIISTYAKNPNISIYLYDSNKNLISKNESNFVYNNYIRLNLVTNNLYYIKIADINSNNAGDYNISISPETTIKTTKSNFNLNLSGSNISNTQSCIFNIEYKADELDVVDLNALSYKLETTFLDTEGANVNLEYFTPGKIGFSLNFPIGDGKAWSGLANAVKFKSKVNYETEVSYSIQYKSSYCYSEKDMQGNIEDNGENPNPGKGEVY